MTPVGKDLDTFWSSLVGGVSGIGPITCFDVAAYKCRIAGEVRDFNPVQYFKTPKDVNRTDRFTQLAVGAANVACALVGGLPAGGGASQTSVADAAGARSQMAQWVNAAAVLTTLLFLPLLDFGGGLPPRTLPNTERQNTLRLVGRRSRHHARC